MAVKHTSHFRFDLWYHFAWSTKYRKKVWVDDVHKARVKAVFRLIAEHHDIEIGEIECLSDHLHLTASAPPEACSRQHCPNSEEHLHQVPV